MLIYSILVFLIYVTLALSLDFHFNHFIPLRIASCYMNDA